MAGPTEYDAPKSLETILYIAGRAKSDLYGTLKLIYVADKFHLERFGRLIYGEDYCAMRWGPVPSHAYDTVKFVRGDRPTSSVPRAKDAFRMEGENFVLLREADTDELSLTDRECLDAAIDRFGQLSFQGFKNLTHDAAWNAAWEAAGDRRSVGIPLPSIASQLQNAQQLIQHLADPHPEVQ